MRSTLIAAAAAASAAGPVQATTGLLFDIDASQSSAFVEVETSGIVGSDTSPVDGTFVVAASPDGGPFTSLRINIADFELTDDINILLDAGFLGRVNVTGMDLAARFPGSSGLGGPGPASPIVAGAFTQMGNVFEPEGTFDYTSSGIISGSIGSGSLVITGSGETANGDLNGTFTTTASGYQINVPFELSGTVMNGSVTGTYLFTGNIVATAPNLLPGDANGDDSVNVTDLGLLAANFRTNVRSGPFGGDFNGDGVVDVTDLGILASNFRSTRPFADLAAEAGIPADAISAVIPEPATLSLLALGGLALRRRHG